MHSPHEDILKSIRPTLDLFDSNTVKVAKVINELSQQAQLVSIAQQFAPNAQRILSYSDSANIGFRATDIPNPLETMGVDVGLRDFVAEISGLHNTVAALYRPPDLPHIVPGSIFDALPDLSPILTQLRQYERESDKGEQALESAGYEFLSYTVVLSTYAEFLKVPAQSRPAAVTNSLLALTRKPEFVSEVIRLMDSTKITKRRLPAIEAAIAAHQGRNYFLSIPVFLSQVEGMIGDALIIKGSVKKQGTKLVPLDKNGNLMLNKSGRPIKVPGLKYLVDHSDWENHDVFAGIAGLATQSLAPNRNAILHGRQPNYKSPKLSLVSLLAIYVLASEFEWIEGAVSN